MKNQIVRFENREDVRVQNDADMGVVFCAVDVCKILGYSNTRQAILTNCDRAGVISIDVSYASGRKKANFINEENLYRLILGSKVPGAKIFKNWVCSVVLPSIRKHGYFVDESKNLTSVDLMEIKKSIALHFQITDNLVLTNAPVYNRDYFVTMRKNGLPGMSIDGNKILFDWVESQNYSDEKLDELWEECKSHLKKGITYQVIEFKTHQKAIDVANELMEKIVKVLKKRRKYD